MFSMRTPIANRVVSSIGVLMSLAGCVPMLTASASQSPAASPSPLDEVGQTISGGHTATYRIRRLPVSSFPDLPAHIARSLMAKGCLIPQTWQARRPENAVHGSLEVAGSYDWAVLCSAKGRVSLLVFLASQSDEEPEVVVDYSETERLRAHDGTSELGFDWGIDVATPQQVHEAQAAMKPRPPMPDHDAIENTTLGGPTSFYLSQDGQHWEKLASAQNK